MKTGIYKITNKINNKNYIGQSIDINERWRYYKRIKKIDYNSLIMSSIWKYGIDNFNFEIVEETSVEDLNQKEMYYIEFYNSHISKGGYNLTKGGDHNIGESNPNSKLTKEDVLLIRKIYNSKSDLNKKEIYENLFKNKVGKRGFEKAWNGVTWKNIDMSCYTLENKNYYKSKAKALKGQKNGMSNLTDEGVLKIRKRYTKETGRQIYQDYKELYSYSGFEKILLGTSYKHLPVYKKSQKKWINN